jgi:hypothetical protein
MGQPDRLWASVRARELGQGVMHGASRLQVRPAVCWKGQFLVQTREKGGGVDGTPSNITRRGILWFSM